MTPSEHPTRLGRYAILHPLGMGAMGCVYLAEDPRLKRKVAIKVVKADALRSEKDQGEFLARFEREAEISGILNDPCIVTIYDLGESELGPFLAMEYVKGHPLDDLIASGEILQGPLTARLRILAGVASALDHAHAHGIVHRDIKPSNVMITEDGHPKLMDFGIAKRDDAALTQTGTFLGTPSYAAPEQIKDGIATPRSDLFSFAVMAFELLSGGLPFPGNSINTILYRIVNEPPVEVQPPVMGLMPDAWRRIFLRALAKHPMERQASCAEFARELVAAASSLTDQQRMEILGLLRAIPSHPSPGLTTLRQAELPPDPRATLVARSRKHRWVLPMSAGLLGVGALATAAWLFMGPRGQQVSLRTTPPGVEVRVDGQPSGPTPKVLVLRSGQRVDFEKKGYVSKSYQHDGVTKELALQLEPLVTEETLSSTPSGAKVVMDGEALTQATPVKVQWDHHKNHSLTFSLLKDGQELGLALDFKEGESPQGRSFQLEPTHKVLLRESVGILRNQGAYAVHLRSGGRDLGEVRPGGTLGLPPGDHTLEIAQPKLFLLRTVRILVSPERAQVLPLPEVVQLTVETFPTSGLVVIDGHVTEVESDGNTPITLVKGPHTIAIKGHGASSRKEDIQASKLLRFRL